MSAKHVSNGVQLNSDNVSHATGCESVFIYCLIALLFLSNFMLISIKFPNRNSPWVVFRYLKVEKWMT